MKMALVELGSLSVALSLATPGDAGEITVFGEFCLDTDLACAVSSEGLLAPEGLEPTLRALKSFRHIIRRQNGIERVKVFAPALVSGCTNVAEFTRELTQILDAPVEVLAAGDEAAYSYLGTHDTVGPPEGGVIVTAEIGATASQLALGSSHAIEDVFTLNLGTGPLARRFLAGSPGPEQALAFAEHLHDLLNVRPLEEAIRGRPFHLIASGPIITSLAALTFSVEANDRDTLHGSWLDLATVEEWFQRLAPLAAAELATLPAVGPMRSAHIQAGIGILLFLMDKLQVAEVAISLQGRRHGMLREVFGLERSFT